MAIVINETVQEKIDNLNETNNAIDSGFDNPKYFNKFFFPVDDLNEYRPFGTNLVQHEANTATIVLVTQKTDSEADKSPVRNYFDDLSATIQMSGFQNLGGNAIPVLDKLGTGYFGIFKNFSLLQVQEARKELVKISLNFGDRWNAFFFDAQPKIYMFTGIFLDAQNYPYYEEFMRAYDNYLAGGKCVQNNFKMYISFDGKITTGWMLGIDTTNDSQDKYHKGFTFQLLIAEENWYRQNYVYDDDGTFITKRVGDLSNAHRIPGYSVNG